jgi:hypothetical protein
MKSLLRTFLSLRNAALREPAKAKQIAEGPMACLAASCDDKNVQKRVADFRAQVK